MTEDDINILKKAAQIAEKGFRTVKNTAEELLEGISEEYENPKEKAEDIGKKLKESGSIESDDNKITVTTHSNITKSKDKEI